MAHPTNPIWQLLVCCSRTEISPSHREQIIEILQGEINWETLLESAKWHKITPLLTWHLQGLGWPRVPDGVKVQLQQQFEQNLRQNFLLVTHLRKLQQVFHHHSLPFLSLKGPALAKRVYGNLALRSMYDLDFLLRHPQDYFTAKTLLAELGYQPYHDLTLAQEELQLKTNFGAAFLNPQTGVQADPHWGLSPPFFTCHLPVADLFHRQGSETLGGCKFPTLSPEDLLLVLCLNGARDGWLELQRLCDVAECVRAFPELDWEGLHCRSRLYNCDRIFFLGLHITQTLLGCPLPPSIQTEIQQHPAILSLTETIQHTLTQSHIPSHTLLQRAAFSLQLQPGPLNKLRFLSRLVFPINERDLEWVQLPRPLFFLYCPLRWVRLGLKYLNIAFFRKY
ncbi:nucleotidyltransferase family protein [Spirulina sp. CS-785/01]|uniref:nucleotidyltransferase domain-containing protein n=1 Tax=Spirulina sp. CS-785/01 TaxID=3021716 RepID=UPI00232FDB8B|nr:nucleotidyltransferase family protein [Spirulina sp. CS-785/01]MDB9311738.1 nucleotidyltransferase family protein [Spirulina sp. CS-785/01]